MKMIPKERRTRSPQRSQGGVSASRILLGLASVALLVLMVGTGAGCGGVATVTTDADSSPEVGGTLAAGGTASGRKPAADFSGVTTAGQEVSLGGYAGRPLVLAFWASW